jgi:hypothetical protein
MTSPTSTGFRFGLGLVIVFGLYEVGISAGQRWLVPALNEMMVHSEPKDQSRILKAGYLPLRVPAEAVQKWRTE